MNTKVLSQAEVVEQTFRENARMKRRQAEVLIAEAAVYDTCAVQVRLAVNIDGERTQKAIAEAVKEALTERDCVAELN